MDRLTNYFGQVPLETDLLHTNQNTMVAIAKLAGGVLGLTTAINGLTVTPTGPASLNVLLNEGEIYEMEDLEATSWSSLPADTADTILKQGILLEAATIGITPPTTTGFSQVFLVEVQYQDEDTGAVVLPFFNAAIPAQPFAGPGNSGSASNTVRKGIVAFQVKAGTAAATGSQVAPTPDAGWTGIFNVTVANGATTITSGNIVQVPSAPFIPVTLPNVPAGVQAAEWIWTGNFGGTANALTATLFPIPTSYTPGMMVAGEFTANNTSATTLNVNGLGAIPCTRADAAVFTGGELAASGMGLFQLNESGNAFELISMLPLAFLSAHISGGGSSSGTQIAFWAGTYGGTANALTATVTGAPTTYTPGTIISGVFASNNTGATTLNVNGLGAIACKRTDLAVFVGGECLTGGIGMFELNEAGNAFELISMLPLAFIEALISFPTLVGVTLLRTSVYTKVSGTLMVSVNGGTPTSSGASSWTAQSGTTQIEVECQAGGGSGAGTANSSTSGPTGYACGGGAAGNYGKSFFTTGFSGAQAITVGNGGSGASSGQNGGNNGGSSSFGSLISCSGGAGAPTSGAPFQVNGWSLAGTGGSGGSTSGISGANVLAIPGQGGGEGMLSTAAGCTNGAAYSGPGGSSYLGQGGAGATAGPFGSGSNGTNGNQGTGYGSGSSGGATTDGGGAQGSQAGQPGIIIVREYANA
jgi:hypothetical protein